MAYKHEQIENIEDTLKNYSFMKNYIEYIDRVIKDKEMIENSITYPSPFNIENTKSGSTYAFHSTVENDAMKLNETYEKCILFKQVIMKIDAALERLKDEERKIISMFYIKDKTWVEISLKLGISER